MPFKLSKQVPGLINHYGGWTRADEDAFYERVSFNDWKGSSGLVPRTPIVKEVEIQTIPLGEKGE